MNRRNFYVVCIYVVWVVIGVVLAIPAAMYLLWPPRPRKEQVWVEAGRVTQLECDTPTEVVFRKNRVDGWRVTSEKSIAWVVKQSDNEIVAFSPRCPHLGCGVHWVAKQNEFLLLALSYLACNLLSSVTRFLPRYPESGFALGA